MVSWAGPWTPPRVERLGPAGPLGMGSRFNGMTYGLIEIGVNIRVYTYIHIYIYNMYMYVYIDR